MPHLAAATRRGAHFLRRRHGLDPGDVGAAFAQALDLLDEDVDRLVFAQRPERREEVAGRPDRSGDDDGPPGVVGDLARDLGGETIELARPAFELVQHQAPAVGAETVGQDDVGARIDEGLMQALDPVRMLGVPELGRIAGGQAHGEKVGAGRAVREQRPAFGEKGLQHVLVLSEAGDALPALFSALGGSAQAAQWPYLYSQSSPTPALEPPLESTPAWSLTWRVTSKFRFTPLSCGLAPVVTPTLTRSLIARVALTRAPPRCARADVQAVDAERFSHILERVGLAGQSRDRVRQLKRLERRQAARRLLKQDARQDFILRQARIGADLKRRLHRGASHRDVGGDAARARLGDEIEIGHHVAVEADIAAGEGQARAQEHERAAQKLEAALSPADRARSRSHAGSRPVRRRCRGHGRKCGSLRKS